LFADIKFVFAKMPSSAEAR